jgi:hypothetical protein
MNDEATAKLTQSLHGALIGRDLPTSRMSPFPILHST